MQWPRARGGAHQQVLGATAQGGLQLAALGMGAHLLGRQHAGVHQRLNDAVVARVRQHLAATEQIQARVASVAPQRLAPLKVEEQRHDRAVHVACGLALAAVPAQLRIGVDQQILHLVDALQRRRGRLLDDVANHQLRGDVAAAVAPGAIGDHAAQPALGMPVPAGVFVVGAPPGAGQDGQFHGRRDGRRRVTRHGAGRRGLRGGGLMLRHGRPQQRGQDARRQRAFGIVERFRRLGQRARGQPVVRIRRRWRRSGGLRRHRGDAHDGLSSCRRSS